MRLPGPLGWLSLGSSVVLATAPAAMALFTAVEGNYLAASVYLLAAVVMFAIPELLLRRLPGPIELLKAYLGRIPGPLAVLKRRLSGDREE